MNFTKLTPNSCLSHKNKSNDINHSRIVNNWFKPLIRAKIEGFHFKVPFHKIGRTSDLMMTSGSNVVKGIKLKYEQNENNFVFLANSEPIFAN